MKITHCKLKKSIHKKLLEFFVLEVTARSAADLLGIQSNSAILFYHKIHKVISYHLALEADDIFDGQIELDESISVDIVKGTLMPVIASKIKPDSWVYTDTYRSYDVLRCKRISPRTNQPF